MMLALSQVESALRPFEKVSERVFPHSSKLSVAVEGEQFEFRSNGKAWPMAPEAVMHTVRWVPGMARAALREWPVDMALNVVNWWLQNGGDQVRLLIRAGEVFSLPGPGSYLKPSRMIEAVTSGYPHGDEIDFESVIVANGQVDLTTVSPHIESLIGGKDRVWGGASLRFRPDGVGNVQFFPYLWREVCSNGLGTRHGFADKKLVQMGTSGDVYDFLTDSSPGVWSSVHEALEALEELRSIDVSAENMGAVVSDLMDRGKIPIRLRARILEAIAVEDDGTMFGVAQGFARAALADGLSPSVVYRLRMAAGSPMTVSEHCEVCARPVGTRKREAISVT